MESLINCINLSKVYSNNVTSTIAIKNINLHIIKNDFISFVGPSGSGKTTLLNILGLLDLPTTGNLYFNEISITELDNEKLALLRCNNYGYVFQLPNLIKHFTVRANVEMPLLLGRYSLLARKEMVNNALENVELLNKIDKYPDQLSGGEQQKVALARAIVKEPIILVLDEPTGSLNEQDTRQIIDLLHKIYYELKTTLLIVTHDMNVASASQKVIKIIDGELQS